MTEALLRLFDIIVRERNQYRQELALYRRAFDAMVTSVDKTGCSAGKQWQYTQDGKADTFIEQILAYRNQSESVVKEAESVSLQA